MANARSSGQLQRDLRSNNNIFERTESVCSVWEEVHDPLSRSAFAAPFAVDDNSNDEINQDLFMSDEYSDDDQDLATIDQGFNSTLSLDQATKTVAAVRQPFILYEPWLYPTKLLVLKIITDNASNRDQAKNILRKILKWTDEEETGPFDWHLGLSLISLEFKSAKTIDLRMLIGLSLQVPYWLKLQTEEIFGKWPKIRKIKTDKSTLKFEKPTYAFSLSYGALINPNRFVSCPETIWTDERFHKCTLHIQDGPRKSSRLDWAFEDRREGRLSNRLSLMNINECVIIDLSDDGFTIYVEQICNMSDYRGSIDNDSTKDVTGHGSIKRTTSETHYRMQSHRGGMGRPPGMFDSKSARHNNRNGWVDFGKYKREARRLNPYFSTVRFTLRHSRSVSHDSSRIIDQALTKLIQIFHSNDITICFGRISEEKGPYPKQCLERPIPDFNIDDFLVEYGWQMLMTSSYRFHLHLDSRLIEFFQNILENEGRTTGRELFYRICVYLIRVFQSRPFLSITETLNKFVREFNRKKNASSYGLNDILLTEDLDWQYIPSVTITPTVLRVNPLKLCRTNRVLRDPFFGSALANFALVDIREENGQQLFAYNFEDLQCFLLDYLKRGFYLGNQRRQYCYLHHTQSQLRQKQFWFYYNDKGKDEKTIYGHLGNFSQERNPAKYAARVAQSFSTTTQTIIVPQENVGRINDIYTFDKKLNFSDGCGTMSEALRNKIKEFLGKRDNFSVVQIRYAGAKGVVSVDTRLQGKIKMNLRKSMIKFDCPNHSYFEVCKLSAARPAFLNRQAILLLSNRKIPDATFIILQQRNYLVLARHLLRNKDAKRCIFNKIPPFLLTPDIDRIKIDYIHEPFFRQLLINTSAQAARELLNKTRIRLPTNLARYMFGIVDEYNVLKPGEVFIQYTVLTDYESSSSNIDRVGSLKIVKDCEVVITKNPCHHPGDVRRFRAADYPELRHLKDVLVFSQQGDRPPTHDISGSDLDGDEYLAVWHPDLVPNQTENYPPFDYDSDIPAEDHPGPIDRDVINKKVLDIAKLDCLGLLSKLHLAFADKFGVNDEKTLKIAKAVSQELDSAKTGFHPYTNEAINRLSDKLEKKRPDFFNDPTFESYQSKEILGQLYRASKRTLKEWNRLFRYHRHLRHLQIRTYDDDAMEEEAANNEEDPTISLDESFYSDIDSQHDNYKECAVFAKDLALLYRAEMLELLNLYGLTHESDVWCENSVNSGGGELEDSAFTELYQLVKRTRTMLYYFQVGPCQGNCEQNTSFNDLCGSCRWRQRIVAVECYRVCYQDASTNPQAAPILSLPWIFSHALLQGRLINPRPILPVLGTRIGNTLHYRICNTDVLFLTGTSLTFSRKDAQIAPIIVDIRVCAFIEILQRSLKKNIDQMRWMLVLKEFIMKECKTNGIYQRISREDGWSLVLEPNEVDINDEYAALLISLNWDENNDEELHQYFEKLISICFEQCRTKNDIKFLEISEKIILLLQKLVIDQTLAD